MRIARAPPACPQCTDPRFRFLNGSYFRKPGVLVALVAPPYAEQMEEQTDEEVLGVLLPLLHATFAPGLRSLPRPLESRITRHRRSIAVQCTPCVVRCGVRTIATTAATAAAS